MTVQAELPEVGAAYSMTYTVLRNGRCDRGCHVHAGQRQGGDDAAVRDGTGGRAGLENMTWYGRGPVETYVDRKFERIGVYNSTVDKQWVDYMRPQENGNKTTCGGWR